MKAYNKQQEEIAHIKKYVTPPGIPPPAVLPFLFRVFHRSVHHPILRVRRRCLLIARRFIASAGTYANLVKQAKSKQKIIDKMEAAGLVEKVEQPRPLRCVALPRARRIALTC